MRKSKATILVAEQGELNIETWLAHVKKHITHQHVEPIRQAALFAQFTGVNHATPNGLSCLQQGLAMAEILLELNVDTDTLIAAIIYNNVRYADLSLDDVSEQFNKRISKLIKGTMQMDASHTMLENIHTGTDSIDNLRKMLLAMVDDMRVVLIKLAERVCILRNMPLYTDEQKRFEAKITNDLYAPLANRLGIGHLKWELEDRAFRYLEAEKYKNISKSLKTKRDQREHYVTNTITLLEDLCKEHSINKFEVTGRAKHIYSIYKKMQRKNVDINEIYDAAAFRILVPKLEDCYTVLGFVHSKWEHIPTEFDDYINQPKSNGYRSIHTAVIGPEKALIEVQIRTYQMHDEAELGVAAHWVYKEGGGKATSSYDSKIALLRQVMDWQKEVTEHESDAGELQQHIFDDRIYVFTPGGDVMDLPKGATPLDFAYHIHSEVGNRCRGAKINNKLVQLTHQLQTGERIEILTSKQGKPSRDWLNPHLGYLVTGRAKAKVHAYFRKLDFDDNLVEGEHILEKEQKRLNLKNINYQKVAEKLNYKATDDMLAGLGRGDIRISSIVGAIETIQQKEKPITDDAFTAPVTAKIKKPPTEIEIHGVGNLLTQIANCCKPIPGDSIVGYVTVGRGVSIHRHDCANLLYNKRLNKNRLIDVNWGIETEDKYQVDLLVDAYDRHGLVRDITNLLAQEKISIAGLNCITNSKDNTAHINLTIEIQSLNPLSRVISKINQLNNVIDVKRVEQ